jgi:hypothetical protein
VSYLRRPDAIRALEAHGLEGLRSRIVYLIGFSGTGKLTVARELALILKARVIDNQWISNPIFGLLDNDRVTPFPVGIWDQIAKVRQAVLETVATLSAPQAAVWVARQLGISCNNPIILHHSQHVSIRLFPSDVACLRWDQKQTWAR